MERRITPSQARNEFRRAQEKQRQTINKYNSDVKRVNAANKRAVDTYNRDVRAHNARVRSNRQKLRSEIAKLNARSVTTVRYVAYQTSVHTLRRSFADVEEASEQGTWTADDELFELAEGETANSLAVLNALLTDQAEEEADEAGLRQTTITAELSDIGADLNARWRGALYALSPSNPDAARHFCTSSREILTKILEMRAPDDEVKAADPNYPPTPNGGVSRRARIEFCLARSGHQDAVLADFVANDIENVITLFNEFNRGTHGGAGSFDLGQLTAIKTRVEHAIQFLHRIVSYPPTLTSA